VLAAASAMGGRNWRDAARGCCGGVREQPHPEATEAMVPVVIGACVALFVLVPGAMLLFYGGRSVKATASARSQAVLDGRLPGPI